jgi:hypothetical protein
MAKHLLFDIGWATWNGVVQNHPQTVMRELGITYQHATPQSLADQWYFWNCENVPEKLPPYLKVIETNPELMIGYGLSAQDAHNIINYQKS